MAVGKTCSECWTSAAPGKTHCPRCGAKLTGATPSVTGLFKSYPWLGVLLGLSLIATLWAATRRPPQPVPVPPSVEAVADPAPVPEPEPEQPLAPPPLTVPAPVEAAPAPAPMRRGSDDPPPPPSTENHQNPDGTWSSGPAPR